MKVMVIVKATAASEAGVLPTQAEFAAMSRFNEELVNAGIMLAGDGLHPTSRGHRVVYSGSAPRVIDGPFAETRELIAGFWLWQVRSMDEALEWIKRAPFGPNDAVELRQVYSHEDFGDALPADVRAREERLREQIGGG